MVTTTDHSNGYALLIGVEDYTKFEENGSANLPAGWNDVLAFWVLCRRLGYSPENIRVLASRDVASSHTVLSPRRRDALEKISEAVPKILGAHKAMLNALPSDVKKKYLFNGITGISMKDFANTWTQLAHSSKALNGQLAEEKLSYREQQIRAAELNYFMKVKTHRDKTPEQLQKELDAWLPSSSILRAAQGDPSAAPTRKQIMDELARMTDYGRTHAGAPLLLTYSGHGARTSRGDLALCPQDVSKGLKNAIPFADLSEVLEPLQGNVTVVLDCCDAAASGTQDEHSQATSLTRPGSKPDNAHLKRFAGRLLCASGRDQQAIQAVFGDTWHGAFTWAVTTVLWQWKMKKHGSMAPDAVTYGHVLEQATGLLKTLNYEQVPELPNKDVGRLRVFQVGSELSSGSEAPSAKRHETQLVPDFKFTIKVIYKEGTIPNEKLLADVFVICAAKANKAGFKNLAGNNYTEDMERWYYDTGAMSALSKEGATLSFTRSGITAYNSSEITSTLKTTNEVSAKGGGWKKDKSPYATSKCFISGSYCVELVVGTSALTNVRWYVKQTDNPTSVGSTSEFTNDNWTLASGARRPDTTWWSNDSW